MKKIFIIEAVVIFTLSLGFISCSSLGMPAKRVEVSSFHEVTPPYVFLVKSISIIDKDGFSTGESFIKDYLISTGYKYGFRFVFPKAKGEADTSEAEKSTPYLLDLLIKEKGFQEGLKELTSISATLHIYRNTGTKQEHGVLEPLLYQVVLTEESNVSIDSYGKLFKVVNEIFGKLHRELKKEKSKSTGKPGKGK